MRATLHYVGLLFWLKSRLLWRNFTRNTSSAVGAVLLILFVGPFSLGLAAGAGAAFVYLSGELPGHVLRAVLLGAYLLWVMAPIFGYALTEDYDLSKLLCYPISARQMLVGAIAGSVLDVGVLMLAPLLLVVLICFSHGVVGALLAFLILTFFLLHTIALSQALALAGAGILRTRRSREIIMVLSMVLAISFYALTQLGSHRMFDSANRLFDSTTDLRVILHGQVWTALGYTPPGLAAHALNAVRQGHFAPAAGLLLGLMMLGVITIFVAGRLVNLVFSGEGPALKRRARPAAAPPRSAPRPQVSSASWLERRLPPVMHAMVMKDSRLLLREPVFRMVLLQSFYFLVMGLVMARPWNAGGLGSGGFSSGMVWFVTVFATLAQSSALYNLFGVEGHAAATLFLFPASRRHLLLGKNLTFFAAFGALDVLVGILLGIFCGVPELCWRLAVWMLLAMGMHITVGNIVSLLFPYRVVMHGWRMRPASASKGMTWGIITLLAGGVSGVLLLPVLAAIIVPTYFVNPYWIALTLPAALAYVVGMYLISLGQAEKLLLAREVQMVEQLSQAD